MDSWLMAAWLLVACVLILDTIILYVRYAPKKKKTLKIGRSMTIGGREVQEDQTGVMETKAGLMAVLADGAGKAYGGRIASRIAVDTCTQIFEDYNAFNNPQYFFRKAFHCANKEILKALGDDSRGAASLGCDDLFRVPLLCCCRKCKNMCVSRGESCASIDRAYGCGVSRTAIS